MSGPGRVDQWGHLTCVPHCGNTPETDGFFPCTPAGVHIEPDKAWQGHYICDACGLIYPPLPDGPAEVWPIGRSVGPEQTPDQVLVAEYMLQDLLLSYDADDTRHRDLSSQIEARFGPDALENTACKATGWHMSSTDIAMWPVAGWDDCFRWLTGEITLDNWETHYPEQAAAIARHRAERASRETRYRVTVDEHSRAFREYTHAELVALGVDLTQITQGRGTQTIPADAFDLDGSLHEDLEQHRDTVGTVLTVEVLT